LIIDKSPLNPSAFSPHFIMIFDVGLLTSYHFALHEYSLELVKSQLKSFDTPHPPSRYPSHTFNIPHHIRTLNIN
jgi:hypothetical protein